CGGLPEADHCQPLQYTVNHPIFNAHNDLLSSQTTFMEQMTQLTSMCAMVCQIIQKKQEEKNIEEEQAANAQYWNIFACCDDDDDYNSAITPNEPVDSLNMGAEHLNTIPATESDEFINSSVETLVPNPSESEGENGCDVPACFTTFSNDLFDANYEFDSVNDQSLSDEDFSEKIFSNPLFEEEINSMKIDPHHFNAESDLIESLLNHDYSIIPSSSKIDSLLDEFAGELTLLKSIPPRIDKTDCYPEEEILTLSWKKLIYPTPDYPMPSGIEEVDYDSERDILIFEELLDNYSLSFSINESYHFDIPSFSRPPAKPPDEGRYTYHPPHPIYETYSGDSCGNDSHFGYDCPPRFPLNYEPEPGYIQNYNSCPHDSPSFPQQYLYCDNYGGPHETFQCQPMNQNFYNSNSSAFDQSQPPQFPVIHQPPQETSIEILDAFGNKQYKPEDIQELFRELFNNVQNIHEELAEYINTPSWNRPAFYNNGDDDDEDCTIAITPDFLITNSLIMGGEHLDTIPEKESDEFIKSSVETLVPNPSEFEDECECDVPDCDDSQTTNFLTFSNPLFDDSTSSDDESSHEEVIHEMSFKTYSLIDSLLAEFAVELIFLKSIPPGIDEANCDTEEDIHLVERFFYDNSSPRPPKEFVSENSNAEIESLSPSPIPVEDSDSFMEEIDLTFTPDDPMPSGIEDDDYDSERDILIREELLDNYSLSLPVIESYHFDIPSFSRPPAKPPDGNTGILNIKMMGDISEQKVPMPRLMITRVLNQEKSPDLLSH
nr:hypothetical protein [Tanacetum cinerariifolium]